MSNRIQIYAILMILAIGALSLTSCGSRPSTVAGTVTQTPSGEPVANAEVVVYELKKFEDVSNMSVYQKGNMLRKELTDENGAFSCSLAPGSYVIQVWVQGQKAADRMVTVEAGRTATVDFEVAVPSP